MVPVVEGMLVSLLHEASPAVGIRVWTSSPPMLCMFSLVVLTRNTLNGSSASLTSYYLERACTCHAVMCL